MKISIKTIIIPIWVIAFINIMQIRAYAYIDPSATTYMIQVIAGILVAVGASVGVVISKLKKKAREKLNIDLDKNKEVEEDIKEVDDAEDK